jgi:hypothetical protein
MILPYIFYRYFRRDDLDRATEHVLLESYLRFLGAGVERCEQAGIPLSEQRRQVLSDLATPALRELEMSLKSNDWGLSAGFVVRAACAQLQA